VLFTLLVFAAFGRAAQGSTRQPARMPLPGWPQVPALTATPSDTPSAAPGETPTETLTATVTATPAETGTETPTSTPTITATLPLTTPASGDLYLPVVANPATPIPATPTVAPTASPTGTLTGTPEGTPEGTLTPSLTPADTPSATPPATGTGTGTPTATATSDPDETPTPPATATPTPTPTSTATVGAPSNLLLPFDANVRDLLGPSDWYASYGKSPELIAAARGAELDVLAQDYDPNTPWHAVLLHLRPDAGGYIVTQALTNLPMLDRVMGLAVDAGGNRYYATAIDESGEVNASYPPAATYRSNIVRVVKVDPAGSVLFDVDLDPARHAANSGAEMIINPMVASSARLAVGGGEIALVHGINTGPDWNIGGQRHQKALSTRLAAADGSILATSNIWVSHSFDQRLLYDGAGLVEYHLGDAYPRYLAFGRSGRSYPLFHIKGPLGENLTATRLGDIAPIANDPTYGYLALFATESTAVAGSMSDPINGPRNLAVVRIDRTDNSVDPNLPDTLAVNSSGTNRTNKLRWLTTYTGASNLHAERPKLVPLGGDQYVVLWEQWYSGSGSDEFRGVYGLTIDAGGGILTPARLLTDQHHLPRGDDAFLLGGRAAWLTGDAANRRLDLHFVDAPLNYERQTVALP
jgi:hypothetical protein